MDTVRNLIVCSLIGLNTITFVVYGIDKHKSRNAKWRIPEATLLMLAVVGGSVGAWLGMKAWRHKTRHKKFRYGVPAILLLHVVTLVFLYVNHCW